jgi:hypothetical protein
MSRSDRCPGGGYSRAGGHHLELGLSEVQSHLERSTAGSGRQRAGCLAQSDHTPEFGCELQILFDGELKVAHMHPSREWATTGARLRSVALRLKDWKEDGSLE